PSQQVVRTGWLSHAADAVGISRAMRTSFRRWPPRSPASTFVVGVHATLSTSVALRPRCKGAEHVDRAAARPSVTRRLAPWLAPAETLTKSTPAHLVRRRGVLIGPRCPSQ